jgi:putative transposase
MARSPRIFFPGAIYHVYCRTARGEMVFSDPLEAHEFVDTIADVKRLHEFLVLGWCLMSNHYHLVIQTRGTPLWRSMARIQCRVARGFNHRHRFLGRLWQSRYKARLVRDDNYCRQLLAYVHLNPVSAGLTDDPAGHEWSGHAALIGRRAPCLVDVRAALCAFGETPGDARAAYLGQVRNVAEMRWLNDDVRNLPWWEDVSNDERFIDDNDAARGFDHQGNPVCQEPVPIVDLVDACRLVCDAAGLTIDDLRSRSRHVDVAAARRTFAILAVEHLGHSVGDVAKLVAKHPGSVSRWLETSGCAADRHRIQSLIQDHCDRLSGECKLGWLPSRL